MFVRKLASSTSFLKNKSPDLIFSKILFVFFLS